MTPLDVAQAVAAHLGTSLAMTATPEPAEIVPDTPPDELVTPGTIGFLVTFFVAVTLVLLVRDMNRRVRRVRVRSDLADARLRDELAEEAGGPGAGDPPPAPGSPEVGGAGLGGPHDPDDGPVRRH
ncbi:hypothetical protein [Aquipuribacter sp. MA13-6]|uniref:hypothetical protein n=1 Tax=unclassified Aquipuribacter TaxID=2635084 RepID=UPI003EEA634C